MTSSKRQKKRSLAWIMGVCVGLSLAAYIGDAFGALVQADDPPETKPAQTTTKPAKEKSKDEKSEDGKSEDEKSKDEKPKEKKSKEDEPQKQVEEPPEKDEGKDSDLADAKKEALASIGKGAAGKNEAGKNKVGKGKAVKRKAEAPKDRPSKSESVKRAEDKGAPAAKGHFDVGVKPPAPRSAETSSSAKPVTPGPQTTMKPVSRKAASERSNDKVEDDDKPRSSPRRTPRRSAPKPDRRTSPRDRLKDRSPPHTKGSRPGRDRPGVEAPGELEDTGGVEVGKTILAPVTDTTTTMSSLRFDVTTTGPESRLYRFDYDATPWTDVLMDFSRMSGLSILNAPDPPISGAISFRSTRDYTYKEALHQLNELLLSRLADKYLIKRKECYLEIKRLPDWMRDIPPDRMFGSFAEIEAANLDPFDIALVQIDVPDGWSPYEIIEEFRPMFSDTYGTQVRGDKIELTGLIREHQRWRNVIEKLTGMAPGGPYEADTRITLTIPLKSARVADVQTILKQLYPVDTRRTKGGRGPGIDQKAETAKQIDIIANIKDNSLIIKASRRKANEIAEMIEKLDSGLPPELPHMKIIRLEYADAAAVQAQLKPIFQKQLAEVAGGGGRKGGADFVPPSMKRILDRDIIADPSTNSVILIGSAEGVADAEQLVLQRDVPDTNVVHEIIELQHAKATDMAATLSAALPGAARGPKGVPAARGAQFMARTSNTLLVLCRKHQLQKVHELVAKLDVPPDDEAKEHLVKLKAARPSVIAPILQQLFAKSGAAPRTTKRKGQPRHVPTGGKIRFIPVDATGYLIVYCADEDWERAESLIKQLDEQERGSEPIWRTFVLQNAEASDVAAMLQQMFPPPAAAKGKVAARQQITADPHNNTINVFASADFIDKVTPLIGKLDIQTKSELTIIRLQHLKAAEVAPILLQSFPGTGGRAPVRRSPKGKGSQRVAPLVSGGGSVRIVAEPVTNSLLVTASPKELEQIQNLVADMEVKAEPTRVILFAQNRPAAEIVEALQSLMGSAPRGRVPRQKGGAARMSSAASGALKIVPDGDRIILEGRQEEVAKAMQWIDQIDVIDQKPVTKKYYVMDAEEDEKKLRAMLAMSPSRPQATPRKGGKGKPQPRRAAMPSAIQIYADTYENTLLIRAMPRDFLEIDELLVLILGEPQDIEGLPKQPEPLEAFFIVRLKYKKALDLAWTLEDLVNTGSKTTIEFDEGPDERMLLVRGCKPAQREKVERYIEMFDVPESGMTLPEDMLVFEPDKMSAEQMMQVILTRYSSPMGRPVQILDTGPAAGRVQIIDIHEGEEEEEEEEQEPERVGAVGFGSPCVMPVSLLCSLQRLTLGQSVGANQPKELPGGAVCPVCGKNPCELVAGLSVTRHTFALASFDDDPPAAGAGDVPAASEVESALGPATTQASPEEPVPSEAVPSSQKTGARRDSRTSSPDASPEAPVDETAETTDSADEAVLGSIKMFVDPFTGKLIVQVPEDEKDFLEDWLGDITSGKAPTVYRVFPLKYADVNTAAQLLNNIFNQPQTRTRRTRQPSRQQPGQPGSKQAQGDQKAGRQKQAPAPPPVPARIKVVPDPRTRSLFVAAPLPDIPLIVDILRKIDGQVPPGKSNIKIFKLVNLDATQVAQNLREILGLTTTSRRPTRQPRGRQGSAQQQQQQKMLQLQGQQGQGTVVSSANVKLTADSQTNSIIAQAPPDQLALIGDLIEQLEEQDNTTKIEMRRVQLIHARATEVAGIVKEIAGKLVSGAAPAGPRGRGAPRRASTGVSVNADARTNSVILAGQVKDLERVEGIVKELDIDDSGSSPIRQFAVKGDPRATADMLKALFSSRGKQSDIVITSNAATGVVLVKAPIPLMAEIEKQIVEMDAKVEAEQALREIKMAFADAEAIAKNLQAIFGDAGGRRSRSGQKITFKGNKSNKTLYVQCPDDRFEEIRQVAQGMDKAPEALQVKAIQLKHASAVAVQKQLETLLAQAARTRGMGDVKLDLIGVLPDARTNSLIVSGGPLTFLLIDQVLAAIDVEPETPVKIETKTYSLPRTVNARDVANNIKELFKNENPRTTGVERPVVTFNSAGNVVTVKANKTQHEEIQKNIIEPVETAVGDPLQDYQVKLQFARADEIKPVLEEFMNKWRQSRGNKPQDGFTITADPNSNLLLLNCSPSTKTVFDKQLAELDTEARKGRDRIVRTYVLKFANLSSVLNAVNQAFRRTGRVPMRDQVNASVDWDTSSVIVLASEENHELVTEMIQSMDIEDTTGGRTTRTFTFKYAEAWHFPNVINQQFRTKSRNPNDQVTASFINGTMSIIVSANPENMEKVAALIVEADVPSAAQKITKYIKLKNARADTLARMLNDAVRASEPRPRSGVYSVVYGSEMSSNTLMVSAAAEKFEEIEARIAELDVADTAGRITRTFTLKYAEPWYLPGIINAQFRDRLSRNPNDQVNASFINGTMSVVVTASEQNMEKVATFIEEVDIPSAAEKVTKFFKLKNARADALANMLNQAIRASEPRPRTGIYSVSYGSDMNSNTLIVTAAEDKFEEIEARITELDAEDRGRITRTFNVRYVAPWTMASIIRGHFRAGSRNPNDQVVASYEDGTQSIVVTANERNMTQVEALIAATDKLPEHIAKETRFIQLKHARADELARTLNESFRAKTVRNRQGQYPVTVTADVASNNLIVTAKTDMFTEIEQMVAELDVEQPGERIRRIFKLTFADPGSVSRAIQQSFQQYGRQASPRDRVTTADDWTTNSVIITASTDNMTEIAELIEELDRPGDQIRSQHIIEVTNSNAGDVARSLQQIFDAANRGRRTQSGSVTIRAIEGTTKIAVNANAEEMKQIQELIKQIDVEGGKTVHAVTMPELVPAKSIAENINKIYSSGRGRDGIKAEYHEPTNTLLVFATDSEFERVNEQVISVLSEQPTIGELKIHKIPLKFAVADEVARTLQDFFDKKGGVQRGRGYRPWWAEQSAEKQLENQVTIIAEPASNMLIVYCTDTTKEMIDDLLADIDTDEPVGGKKVMEMVALKYMDAAEMLEILTEYLKVSKRTKEDTSDNTPWWMRGRGGSQKEEKVVLAGDMRLKAVESSNSIIIVGRPESVKDVLAKIEEMDVEDAEGANVPKTIKLANANAMEMADTLDSIFNDPKRNKARGASYVPPTIVAVEATNSLVIRAKPSEFNLIEKMAGGLDAEMEDSGGVRLLRVPIGRSVEKLATVIEAQINENEENKKQQNKSYRPSKVTIGADTISNVLMVAGSKAQYEEVKRLVNELVAMGPAGGTSRRVIKLKNLSPDKAKRLIEQLQQDKEGSGGSSGRRSGRGRGRRSDADWTQYRRYENVETSKRRNVETLKCRNEESRALARAAAPTLLSSEIFAPHEENCGTGVSPVGTRAGRPCHNVGAATLPVLAAQIALTSAIAQTPTTQPAQEQKNRLEDKLARSQPVISKIRPRRATTQPAVEPDRDKPARGAGRRRPPAKAGGSLQRGSPPAKAGGSEKRRTRQGMTPEERILATTQSAESPFWSQGAQEAVQRRLTGAPIEIAEASTDTIIVDANDEDMEVILSIIEMLDTAVPEKKIEYIRLKNSRASDLAKILQDVFSKVEKVGERQPGPEDKVDIIADPRTNGIYIAATEEKMVQALDLIRKNEEAEDIGKEVRTFTFTNRRVFEAGEVLKKMVASYLKQKKLTPDAIGVELDLQTNSVFITGGETDLEFVEKIFQGLDAELPDEEEMKEGAKRPMQEADIMLVPLRVADADKLGTLLNDLLQRAAVGETPMKDFIRRMRLLDENGEPIAQIDLTRPIAVFGDQDSNSLIIASSKENCLIMKQIAVAFDKEPARAEVSHVVLTLDYADATEVADQLGTLLADSEALTQRPGKSDKFGLPDGESGALVYTAVVQADPRTNQVVIVGRPESVVILEGLVKALDVKGLDVMPFEIVKLEYASSTALEQALTDMMEKRAEALPKGTGPNADKAETVIIKADPRSESLIIAAKPARMEELRGLIKKLDIKASALIENIRTITLDNGNANDLADKLKDLWEQRQNQRESGSEGLKLEIPAIVADERSNSLIVAASKADFEAIKAVVDKIEALELNPMANIYLVRMEFNSASQLAPAFATLFQKRAEMRSADGKTRPEDEVAIEVDEVTNSLLVAASRENYEVLMQKVAELDREIGVPGQIEFFVCDNVGAGRVKDTIDELFDEGVYKPGGVGESQLAKDREEVTISVDDRSNILIVSASPENMELVREIYKRMNSVTLPWDVAITRLVIIEHGDSVKIAAQVQEYFDKLRDIRESGSGGDGKSGAGFEITVFADDRSNRIIIGGTKDGIDSAVEMVRKLDVPPGTPGQIMEVYTLLEAPATTVGEMIDRVFQERNQPRQGATGAQVPNITVTVEANDTTNSLLINASREDHILISDLVGRLDRPSTIIDMVRVFPLEKARAERVKEILEELYQSAGGGEGRSGRTIAVVEDMRTNAVVVAAPPGELENIAELVARLDETEVKGQAEIGVYTCDNEDAEKMAELLNDIMTGETSQGGGGEVSEEAREISSMLISFSSRDPGGREAFLKTIRENVQITFNVRSNSVIVVAPPSSLKLIEALVHRLDRIEKRPVLVKVFQLVNADATRMVDLLEEMFAYEEGSESEREFQQGREMSVEGGLSATGGVPMAASQGGLMRKGTFGRPKTVFVADERTNSIISAGWPEDVDVVADIIDQLDSRAIQDRDNVVYTLVNAEAEDVQAALESYFQAEQARLDRLGDTLSPQRRMDQEVSVVSHEASNQLIISASPRYRSDVMSIVEQLDTPPPQVMIQVMIAEVTLDDRFEMGLEFALQELRFSETAVVGGNNVLQSSHFDVVGGTDLGAAGSGIAGFSFTVTGEDFNFLVRALQSDSRLEVIQRPMIMCQDNMEANITIGQDVPFVRNSSVSDSGQVTANVEYEKVGTILDIEPHINPDGFVYLKVAPEISAISDSTIDIGNGVLAPIFTERSAETTVAVMDGETVVIGGLITTTEREAESKVPFLGDIPGLGALFRSTTRNKQKTELLIALTPHIVRTIEDGRRMSIMARDEAGIITDNMKQSVLFGKLRITPEEQDELYDIETPPGKVEPGAPVETDSKEKYGPKAPRYGPLTPADDDVVAQRDQEIVWSRISADR